MKCGWNHDSFQKKGLLGLIWMQRGIEHNYLDNQRNFSNKELDGLDKEVYIRLEPYYLSNQHNFSNKELDGLDKEDVHQARTLLP